MGRGERLTSTEVVDELEEDISHYYSSATESEESIVTYDESSSSPASKSPVNYPITRTSVEKRNSDKFSPSSCLPIPMSLHLPDAGGGKGSAALRADWPTDLPVTPIPTYGDNIIDPKCSATVQKFMTHIRHHGLSGQRWPSTFQQAQVDGQGPDNDDGLLCFQAIPYTPPLHHMCGPITSIQRIHDLSHPAHGQFGLFARIELPPHTYLFDYLGLIRHESLIGSAKPTAQDYNITFIQHPWVIDAHDISNEARFINDFRGGVASRPNVYFDSYWDPVKHRFGVGVWTLNQPIAVGKELVVSYGKSFWRERGVKVLGPEWDSSWDS